MEIAGIIGLIMMSVAWLLLVADRSRILRENGNGFGDFRRATLGEMKRFTWKIGLLVFLVIIFFHPRLAHQLREYCKILLEHSGVNLEGYLSVRELLNFIIFLMIEISLTVLTTVGWIFSHLLSQKHLK